MRLLLESLHPLPPGHRLRTRHVGAQKETKVLSTKGFAVHGTLCALRYEWT
jgi:hypothetical protein